MGRAVFITGGARSGKSAFALSLAAQIPGTRAFIATMEPRDEECAERIRLHKLQRGAEWHSYEEPLDIEPVIEGIAEGVVVLDCLTLWLSNLMGAGRDIAAACDALVQAIQRAASPIILITNEVGQGLVPENALARAFRDEAGLLNQRVAAQADRVVLLAAGHPLTLKEAAVPAERAP